MRVVARSESPVGDSKAAHRRGFHVGRLARAPGKLPGWFAPDGAIADSGLFCAFCRTQRRRRDYDVRLVDMLFAGVDSTHVRRCARAARPRVGRARAQRRRPLEARSAAGRGPSATADPYLFTSPSSSTPPLLDTGGRRFASRRAGALRLGGAVGVVVDAYIWLVCDVSVSGAVVLSVHACMYFSGLLAHGSSAYDVHTFHYYTHWSLITASGRPTHVIQCHSPHRDGAHSAHTLAAESRGQLARDAAHAAGLQHAAHVAHASVCWPA